MVFKAIQKIQKFGHKALLTLKPTCLTNAMANLYMLCFLILCAYGSNFTYLRKERNSKLMVFRCSAALNFAQIVDKMSNECLDEGTKT